MKRMMLFTLAATVAAVFSSCSDDTLEDLTLTETEGMSEGVWKVTFYKDNSNDDSNDVIGYTLDMQDDGTLIVTGGGASYTGTWMIKNSDDDPAYSKEIDFMVVGDDNVDEIEGSWLIAVLTDTRMELLDDTPSEEMHLTKQ